MSSFWWGIRAPWNLNFRIHECSLKTEDIIPPIMTSTKKYLVITLLRCACMVKNYYIKHDIKKLLTFNLYPVNNILFNFHHHNRWQSKVNELNESKHTKKIKLFSTSHKISYDMISQRCCSNQKPTQNYCKISGLT